MHKRIFLALASVSAIVIASCIGDSLKAPTTKCDPPDEFCGACTNLQTDLRNCGACGKVCNVTTGETCQKGACGPPCTGGTSRCGMGCVDLLNDPQNCGSCGNKCGAGEACSGSKCMLPCRSGLNSCPTSPLPTGDAGASDGGSSSASNKCVDFQNDADHCSKCGNKCPVEKPFCDFGQCKLYKWSGILTNVNLDDLSPRWTECFSETYGVSGTSLTGTVLTKCPQANLMMACRQPATKILLVAAMAPRADVTFDVGTAAGAHHTANGTDWYFNANWSWGFAMPVDGITRDSCDVSMGNYPERRICWHTYSNTLDSGYRCGKNISFASEYDRVIFQTP